MSIIKQTRAVTLLCALALGQSLASAQAITVTYGPLSVASVPTLSEWAMVGLAVLLAVVALIALRKNDSSRKIISLALAAAGLLGASQGHKFLQEAIAIAPGMTSPTGGTVNLTEGSGTIPVLNNTSVPLKILTVTPDLVRDRVDTTCKPGVVVPASGSCDVDTGAFVPA